jgi:sugar transferase (PEP-CTERM system associated)
MKPDLATPHRHHSRRRRRVSLRRKSGVLVVGRGPLADSIVLQLQSRRSRYRLVGWLDKEAGMAPMPSADGNCALDPSSCALDHNMIAMSRLDWIAEREGADCIVVAMPERRGDLPLDQLLACRLKRIHVHDGMAFHEQIGRKIALSGLQPGYLVFNGGFHWPSQAAKRLVDLFLSSLGLLLTAPLFLLLPLIIKATSAGPVLYRQQRAGLNGRRFTIYKFRSMYDQAEQSGSPVWAQEHDPRITAIGRFMRKYRLDELPQMINVLRGDMSFVGPRPERPEFVALLAREIPFYGLRLSVKPGITGWAQVMFRYGATVEDAAEKLQYDLYYVKHMSLALDSVIALKTIRTVLFQSGAR